MSKIIVYMRVSTDKQDTENQRFGVEKFCKEKGFEVAEWIEETMSGTKDVKDRKIGPVLDKLDEGDTLGADVSDKIVPAIKALQQENERLREKECKAFAYWLSNTVIAGRTITKLLNDYLNEIDNSEPLKS